VPDAFIAMKAVIDSERGREGIDDERVLGPRSRRRGWQRSVGSF
jgi:hypothetical protein